MIVINKLLEKSVQGTRSSSLLEDGEKSLDQLLALLSKLWIKVSLEGSKALKAYGHTGNKYK